MLDVVILGCGYTGTRVASRFLHRGAQVTVTARDTSSLADLAVRGARVIGFDAARLTALDIPADSLLLYSLPIVETSAGEILKCLSRMPRRVVYFSTTSVYGAVRDVDEHTLPDPDTEQSRLRLAAEEAVRAGLWSSLILRPAAIYGPDRGVHVAMRHGHFQLSGAGDNFVSRIHVDDLAAHAEAALLSDLTGAYPVADDLPCTSREIAEFCAQRFHLPLPPSTPREQLHETRRSDRRVDGRAVRSLLQITLLYPTYRAGILATQHT